MISPGSKTLVVVGDIRLAKCKSVLQKLRKNYGSIAVVRVSDSMFPVWEEGYELFFLTMGRSAMDDVAIAEKYGCSTDEVYTALWSELANSHRLSIGSVAAVVFSFDLGWAPEDMAELFMSHLPLDVALANVFPIRNGKTLRYGTPEYQRTYHAIADCPETTLEI